jgi:hypothetical protein
MERVGLKPRGQVIAVVSLALLLLCWNVRFQPDGVDPAGVATGSASVESNDIALAGGDSAAAAAETATRGAVVGTSRHVTDSAAAPLARRRRVSPNVASLVDAIAAAHDVDAATFCDEQRKRVWQRLEALSPPALVARLREQRALHEAVARGEAPPRQKYLVWSLSGGMGNRFLSLASTFVAAIMSRRVFLMKDWFTQLPPGNVKQTPVILPSPNTADYFLEDLRKLFADRPANDELLCPLLPMMSLSEFRRKYPKEFDAANGAEHAKVDIAARHDKTLRRWDHFLCRRLDAQSGAADTARNDTIFFPERFVYVWTNQYYLPALFANPHHAAELQRMFPDGTPFQDVLGLLAIPSLPVVKKLRAFFDREGAAGPGPHLVAPRAAGVGEGSFDALQIRAFRNHEINSMARDFDTCWSKVRSRDATAAQREPFFLASMHAEVRSYFAAQYGSHARTQAPPTKDQCTSGNATCDQEAFADMMLLGLSRRLFVSPGSTFGMFVAAFAELPPYAVREHGSCRVIPNVEPCFGAWFRRDHLLRRSMAKPSPLSCTLARVPPKIINCEQS